MLQEKISVYKINFVELLFYFFCINFVILLILSSTSVLFFLAANYILLSILMVKLNKTHFKKNQIWDSTIGYISTSIWEAETGVRDRDFPALKLEGYVLSCPKVRGIWTSPP